MSNNIFTPQVAAVVDPIISIQEKAVYPVIKGGMETTERDFVSNSFSTASAQFSCPPPNPQTFVSRRFMLKLQFDLTIQFTVFGYNASQGGIKPNQIILASGSDAFRQYPLASMMKTLNVTLNGSTITLPVNDVIKPLLLYNNNGRDLEARNMSLSPGMRDQSQNYSDLVGFHRNPLGTFGDGDFRQGAGRGSFPFEFEQTGLTYDAESGNSTGSIKITATLIEELYISPLIFGGGRCSADGFIGLQSIDINITWDNNPAKMWSHAPDATTIINNSDYLYDLTGFSWEIGTTDKPSILFRYVTPPIGMRIPRNLQYNYNLIDRYNTEIADNVGYLDDYNGISNNIQLNSIPHRLYILVRRREAQLQDVNACVHPDCYASINNIQVNWNNKNALLANATQAQLYDISRKNCVDMSYPEWSGLSTYLNWGTTSSQLLGLGSVLCLEFGTDIGLEDGEAPGLIGTYNLFVRVSGKWINQNYNMDQTTNAIRAGIDLYLIVVTPGIWTIYDNAASQRIGVISKDVVRRAGKLSGLDYWDTKESLMSGGINFRKAFKRAKKKAKQIGRKAVKQGKRGFKRAKRAVMPALREASNIARDVASNVASDVISGMGMYAAGRRRKRRMSAPRGYTAAGRRRKKPGPKKGKRRKPGRPRKKKR